MVRIWALGVVGGISLLSSGALAQTADAKTSARQLGIEAQKALDARDFATSEDRFRLSIAIFDEAHAFVPPTLLIGLARAHVGQGHFVAAYEAYDRLITAGVPAGSPPVFAKALADAKKEIDIVGAQVGWAQVHVTGCENARTFVDGVEIPASAIEKKRAMEPGLHAVRATAAGCGEKEKAFKVELGATADIGLVLSREAVAVAPVSPPPASVASQPPPPPVVQPHSMATGPAPFPYKAGAIVSFGIAGAGLVTSVVAGVMAISQHNELRDQCPTYACPSSPGFDQDAISTYETTGAISTVGALVAGTGAVAGVVFLVLDARSHRTERAFVAPVIGPGTAGFTGRF